MLLKIKITISVLEKYTFMKSYITEIFIIDKIFKVEFYPNKEAAKIGIGSGQIERETHVVRLPYSFNKRNNIQQKTILYHLYFIIDLSKWDSMGADKLVIEQLAGEGYSKKEIFVNFIKLSKNFIKTESSIKRLNDIINYMK